jgi:hypothetical protein
MRPTRATFSGNNELAICAFVLEGEALRRFRSMCNDIPDYDEVGRHLEKCLGLIFEAAEEKYGQDGSAREN